MSEEYFNILLTSSISILIIPSHEPSSFMLPYLPSGDSTMVKSNCNFFEKMGHQHSNLVNYPECVMVADRSQKIIFGEYI